MKPAHLVLLLATAFFSIVQPCSAQSDSETPFENELNTASLKADGKSFKLILIGDCLPQLFVNGEKIAKAELSFYEQEIDKLTGQIEDRQRKEWDRKKALLEKMKRQIVADLVQQGIVPAESAIRSYYLTTHLFKVNGKVQKQATFNFFKTKYVKSEDKVFYYENEKAH